MTSMMHRRLIVVALGLCMALWGWRLHAQEPSSGDARDQARERFMRGVALFEDGAFDGALVEFRASRQRFPTRVATRNEAICLRELGRFDEALDVLELLQLKFDGMNEKWRAMVSRDMAEVSTRVGRVRLDVNEPGATIILSGRTRGTTPLGSSLRVTSGSHPIRIDKPGFAPFEGRVEVAGQQEERVVVELRPLDRSGSLTVTEVASTPARVFVDRSPVGEAPWSGRLSPGAHTIRLVGAGELATPPASVKVVEGEVANLALRLTPLSATLRIEPQPLGARVALDGVALGRGVWEGRIADGSHRVEVAAEGFLTRALDVEVAPDAISKRQITLERDPTSPAWQVLNPPRVVIDVALGVAFGPSLAGELDDCDDCGRAPPVGGRASLRAGYRLGLGLGFFADVGYLSLYQRIAARPAELFGVTGAEAERDAGSVRDEVLLQGLMVGAGVSYLTRLGDWDLRGRVGGGGIFGSVHIRRNGSFRTSADAPYTVGPYVESDAARLVYVAPELRLDYRLHPNVALGAGLGVLFAIDLAQPRWRDDRRVPSPTPFLGGFNPPGDQARSLGHFLVFIPDFGLRVDL
jgi:PEGA domain